MNKIFFDANILLDLLITNRAGHTLALQALPRISERYEILVTSEDIFTTVEYIASRHKIPCRKTSAFFLMLYESFEICNFTPIFPTVLPLYAKICGEGGKMDFEDFMQLHCAMDAGCDTFLTEDRGISGSEWDMQIAGLKEFL